MNKFKVQIWKPSGGLQFEVVIEAQNRDYARRVAELQYPGMRIGHISPL